MLVAHSNHSGTVLIYTCCPRGCVHCTPFGGKVWRINHGTTLTTRQSFPFREVHHLLVCWAGALKANKWTSFSFPGPTASRPSRTYSFFDPLGQITEASPSLVASVPLSTLTSLASVNGETQKSTAALSGCQMEFGTWKPSAAKEAAHTAPHRGLICFSLSLAHQLSFPMTPGQQFHCWIQPQV